MTTLEGIKNLFTKLDLMDGTEDKNIDVKEISKIPIAESFKDFTKNEIESLQKILAYTQQNNIETLDYNSYEIFAKENFDIENYPMLPKNKMIGSIGFGLERNNYLPETAEKIIFPVFYGINFGQKTSDTTGVSILARCDLSLLSNQDGVVDGICGAFGGGFGATFALIGKSLSFNTDFTMGYKNATLTECEAIDRIDYVFSGMFFRADLALNFKEDDALFGLKFGVFTELYSFDKKIYMRNSFGNRFPLEEANLSSANFGFYVSTLLTSPD